MKQAIYFLCACVASLITACSPTAYNKDGVPTEALIYHIGYGHNGPQKTISQVSKITAVSNGQVMYQLSSLPAGPARLIGDLFTGDFSIGKSVPPGSYVVDYWCRYENTSGPDSQLGTGEQTITVRAGEAWALSNTNSYAGYISPFGPPVITGIACSPGFKQVAYPKS